MKDIKWIEGKEIIFRGCTWDENWEFDGSCVVYDPVGRYGISGNTSIDSMVENVALELCRDGVVIGKWSESDVDEFKWRRWDKNGFGKRKNATHVEIAIKCIVGDNGERWFEYIEMEKENNV